MTLEVNSFNFQKARGAYKNRGIIALQGIIDPASTDTLHAGDLVALTGGTEGEYCFTKATAADTSALGFIVKTLKTDTYTANTPVSVALLGDKGIITCEVGTGGIGALAEVFFDTATGMIIDATSATAVSVGTAMQVGAEGDLIKVLLNK